jgi:osmotically-inducible protein OsmY
MPLLRPLLIGLAVLSLASACVQNRTLGQGIDDVGADLNLKRKLLTDNVLKTGDVDIAIFEGRLLLTGTVPTERDRAGLVDKARATTGVREVIDELRVGPRTPVKQGAADAVIDERLGAALLADSAVYRGNYQISVSQGTVYLLGVAQGPNELSRVTSHAAAVPGVRDVVSHVIFVGDPRRAAPR